MMKRLLTARRKRRMPTTLSLLALVGLIALGLCVFSTRA
jgi:hypothetical protein